jgi:peptide deformylase
MAVLPILQFPDACLAARCLSARPDPATRRLAEDMLETMYAAPGRGLAAPQVGVLERLFVMDAGWKDGRPRPVIVLNPEFVWVSPRRIFGQESCLSIRGAVVEVERAAEVRMRWTAIDGTLREETFSGFEAICAQHESDHLDGLLVLDRITPGAIPLVRSEAVA